VTMLTLCIVCHHVGSEVSVAFRNPPRASTFVANTLHCNQLNDGN